MVLLAPVVLALLYAAGAVTGAAGLGGVIAYLALTVWMTALHRLDGVPVWVAPLWPLGTCVVGFIFARAILRGDQVEWKGRRYASR